MNSLSARRTDPCPLVTKFVLALLLIVSLEGNAEDKVGVAGLPENPYASRDAFECYEATQHALPKGASEYTTLLYSLCPSKEFNAQARKVLSRAYEEFAKRILSVPVYDCLKATHPAHASLRESHAAFVAHWIVPSNGPHIYGSALTNGWVFLSPIAYPDRGGARYADAFLNGFVQKRAQLEGKTYLQVVSLGIWKQALETSEGPLSNDVNFWAGVLGLAHFKSLGLSLEDGPEGFAPRLAACIAWNGKIPDAHLVGAAKGGAK